MKNLIFILATSMLVLAGCGSDTAAVAVASAAAAAAGPVNGYVTPAGINAVPSQ
jgi:hypothetical protein